MRNIRTLDRDIYRDYTNRYNIIKKREDFYTNFFLIYFFN